MVIDWQTIVTFVIVSFAAYAVGKRLFVQVRAIIKTATVNSVLRDAAECSGCTGCAARQAGNVRPQLVNISLSAPKRLPSSGDSREPEMRN